MAKKVTGFVKLQIPAGKANPAPPVGTALGPQGINIMGFCKEFNARTQGGDMIIPVEVTIYADKSFTFILKTPPAAELIKKEIGVDKGSGQPKEREDRIPFGMALVVVAVLVALFIDPPRVLLLMAGTYAASGPLYWLWLKLKPKSASA